MTETHWRNQHVFLYTLFVCRDEWQNSKKNLEATSETAINTQLKQGGFPNSLDSLTLTDVCGHFASGSIDLIAPKKTIDHEFINTF